MRSRLEIILRLLRDDGSFWVTIDDSEAHYLKVLLDEILVRRNYVASMAWEKDSGRKKDTSISSSHDYVLLYAKSFDLWRKTRNLLERSNDQLSRYQNPDNDLRGPWRQGADGTAKSGSVSLRYEVTLPSGRVVTPPSGNYWRFSKATFEKSKAEGRVYFGKDGDRLPVIKKYLKDIQEGIVPKTWWPADEVGSNQEDGRDHLRKLLPDIQPFDTPKPERLIHRIIQTGTNPGDLVPDLFAGSGTTDTVAHKMGRRWIMVELGKHCHTHIIPRMKKVIDGEDPGGITKAVGWKGGGGFRYYRLAPSLLEKDRWGNWVINDAYNAAMLAEAVCKLKGFVYAPSETLYWQHGHSTETDFIYVTTQTLTYEQLQSLSDEVGEHRSLLVCFSAFRAKRDAFSNLTLKRISKAVMERCEWGNDDYSLRVENLPRAPQEPEQAALDLGGEEEET
jgi:adenine-specific DNA-methyltransferase